MSIGEATSDTDAAGGFGRFALIRMTPDSDCLGVGLGVGEGISGVGMLLDFLGRFGGLGAALSSGAAAVELGGLGFGGRGVALVAARLPAVAARFAGGFAATLRTADRAAAVLRATLFFAAGLGDGFRVAVTAVFADFLAAAALALFLAAEDFAGSGRFAERSEREAPLFRPGRGAGFAALLVAELFRFEAPGRCWARARFLVV